MQELVDRISGDLNARIAGVEGALTRRALSVLRIFTPMLAVVMAGVAYLIYEYLDFAVDQFFVQTAGGDNLSRWGELWDTPRKAATFARRRARISGNEGVEVPVGRTLQRSDGVQYRVLAGDDPWITQAHDDVFYVDVDVQAVLAGADGNAEAGTPLIFTSPVAGLDSEAVIAEGGEVAGSNAELDADLKERILFRIAYPPSGGAPLDYIRWAEETTAVQRAWCLRSYPEPGYATVLFVTRDAFDGPIPDGGGAYSLVLSEVGEDEDGYYAKIDKDVLETMLGRTPEAGWFAGGALIHDLANPLGCATSHLDDDGLRDDDDEWKIVFPAAPSPALTTAEEVCLLCLYTADVYASIHHRDETRNVEDRKPSEATCFVLLPQPKAVDVTLSLPNDTPALRESITAELAAAIADERGPNVTLTAWQIRQAISQAPGHIAHRLLDVNGGGSDGDVTTGFLEVHVLGTVTFDPWS
jgi:uncharacterized phage protein gp47/JayE